MAARRLAHDRRAPDAVSLGQTAYRAYWRRWPATALPWRLVTLRERRAWEAAARAAIVAWQAQQAVATDVPAPPAGG